MTSTASKTLPLAEPAGPARIRRAVAAVVVVLAVSVGSLTFTPAPPANAADGDGFCSYAATAAWTDAAFVVVAIPMFFTLPMSGIAATVALGTGMIAAHRTACAPDPADPDQQTSMMDYTADQIAKYAAGDVDTRALRELAAHAEAIQSQLAERVARIEVALDPARGVPEPEARQLFQFLLGLDLQVALVQARAKTFTWKGTLPFATMASTRALALTFAHRLAQIHQPLGAFTGLLATKVATVRQDAVDALRAAEAELRSLVAQPTIVRDTAWNPLPSPTVAVVDDADGDGLAGNDEVRTHLTSPRLADSDFGGVHDGDEVRFGTDPNDPADDDVDSDFDGLLDKEEAAIGTDPENPDSDGDGRTDGMEHRFPHTSTEVGGQYGPHGDADGDRLQNGAEVVIGSNTVNADSDGDGFSDFDEVMVKGTDPLRANRESAYSYRGVRVALEDLPPHLAAAFDDADHCVAVEFRDAAGRGVGAVDSPCSAGPLGPGDLQRHYDRVWTEYSQYRTYLLGTVGADLTVSSWHLSGQASYLVNNRFSADQSESERCLAVDGDAVTVAACDFDLARGADQMWRYRLGSQHIENLGTGRCLDTGDRQQVVVTDCPALGGDRVPSQDWVLNPVGYLVNTATGRCLDLSAVEPGAEARLADCQYGRASGSRSDSPDGSWKYDPMTNQVWRQQPVAEISVTASGEGTGTVVADGGSCEAPQNCRYDVGEVVTLRAEPGPNSVFTGWSGVCAGSEPVCVVEAGDLPLATSAAFETTSGLTVAVTGPGSVTSDRGGIDCGPSVAGEPLPAGCSATVAGDDRVTLTAEPDIDRIFLGWAGACTGTAPTCAVDPAASGGQVGVSAAFAPTADLTVTKRGSGSGSVTAAGLECLSSCDSASALFGVGQVVTLRAQPSTSSVFVGWSGACGSVTEPVCPVTMASGAEVDEDGNITAGAGTAVTARFERRVTVDVTVAGAGSVRSESPGGEAVDGPIDCASAGGPTTCGAEVAQGTALVIRAAAGPSSAFHAWTGACAGSTADVCEVAVGGNTSVGATFVPVVDLTATAHGVGRIVLPAGARDSEITCDAPAPCAAAYARGSEVALRAVPGDGQILTAWAAPCREPDAARGLSLTCTVDMAEATVAHAYFEDGTPVDVAPEGPGQGTVTSWPTGISCAVSSDACAATLRSGDTVELLAVPSKGSVFEGWSGPCAPAVPWCLLELSGTAPVRVAPQFGIAGGKNLKRLRIDLTEAGAGARVVSAPGAAACDAGEVCEFLHPAGAQVTLTAERGFATRFDSWGGTCQGDGADARGTCTVTMSVARTLTPVFAPVELAAVRPVSVGQESVEADGQDEAGAGTVRTVGETGTGGGLSCGSICTGEFFTGTLLTLQAQPAPGSAFAGWTGSCAGQPADCRLVVADDESANRATARFAPARMLSVAVAGSGGGKGVVRSDPVGVECTTDDGVCEGAFARRSTVVLRATPRPGSVLGAWTGACAGSATTCQVPLTDAARVGAVFRPAPGDRPTQGPVPVPVSASCGGRKATIVGTRRKDVLVGTRGPDVIAGLAGNDVIKGLGGADLICGGSGSDRLLGGSGNDRLIGGLGNDRLLGAAGKDALYGGRGRDRCNGGTGRDRATSCEQKKDVP